MEKAAVGDYSFLISSIEKHLAQYEGAESSFIAPEPSRIEPSTTTKRTYENISNSISTPSVNQNKSAPPISTAKKIRLEAESDELRLINEQLNDKLIRITDDSERIKEKLQRQLTFLDNENNELRHAITKANDKYFEDKKNTTIQLRNYENEINALKKQITTLESTTTTTSSTITQDKSKQIKETSYQNLDIFEAKLVEKVQEVKKLSILNAELEEKISYLEQDVLVLKTKYHSSSSSSSGGVGVSSSGLVYTSGIGLAPSSAAAGVGVGTGTGPSETYIKSLEKKSEEYDMQLRRKNKEIEKLNSKLENQSILEDENMSLKAKVQYLNTQLTESLSIETKYKTLMQEKASWNQLFKQVVQDSKHIATSTESSVGSSVSTHEEVSPMAVLRILSGTQQRCTLALDREGKLELQVKEQKRAIVALEQQVASLKDDLAQYEDKEQEHVRKTKLLSQQLQLYTGEIDNLRSLMRSYDAELKIGHKPDATMTMLLSGKDDTIASLRKETDECRAAVRQHVEALLSLQDELKRLSAQQLQQQLQQQSETAKPGDSKYAAYAKEDLDFDPATTKVRRIHHTKVHLLPNFKLFHYCYAGSPSRREPILAQEGPSRPRLLSLPLPPTNRRRGRQRPLTYLSRQ